MSMCYPALKKTNELSKTCFSSTVNTLWDRLLLYFFLFSFVFRMFCCLGFHRVSILRVAGLYNCWGNLCLIFLPGVLQRRCSERSGVTKRYLGWTGKPAIFMWKMLEPELAMLYLTGLIVCVHLTNPEWSLNGNVYIVYCILAFGVHGCRAFYL